MNPASRLQQTLPPIRSYVLRGGRFTKSQRAALQSHWPEYGVDTAQGLLDLQTLYSKAQPVVLDIGFGDGEALALLSRCHPQLNFLGVEVYRPGVGALLQKIAASRLENVRVIHADAVDVLSEQIAPKSLAAVLIWFPDPWPKRRHHKRRLVQPEFIRLVGEKLGGGGELSLATDWQPYANHIQVVLGACKVFENADTSALIGERPSTKFERRGLRHGHRVFAQMYRKVG